MPSTKKRIAQILKTIREPSPDPDEPARDEPERIARNFLDQWEDEVERRQNRPRLPWIFRRDPEKRLFVEILAAEIRDHADQARAFALETLAAIREERQEICACRCRLHGRMACALCLAVERCEVHS